MPQDSDPPLVLVLREVHEAGDELSARHTWTDGLTTIEHNGDERQQSEGQQPFCSRERPCGRPIIAAVLQVSNWVLRQGTDHRPKDQLNPELLGNLHQWIGEYLDKKRRGIIS